MTAQHTTLHNSRMNLLLPRFASSALVVALLTTGWSANAQERNQPQTQLPRIELRAGMHRIHAQVAAQFQERQVGLMHRKSMPQNEGMLFVFERPGIQCFWMKDTLLPLTAAFLADDGSIVNLADMKPRDETSHCSTQPVRFVLEMNQGWFQQRNLKAGSQLTGVLFHSPQSSTTP